MKIEDVEKIANAVLYEGFLLDPYRTSAMANLERFNYGALCPRAYCESQEGADHWQLQMECLLAGNAATPVELKIRFLQLSATAGGQEAVERSIQAPACGLYSLQMRPLHRKFQFEALCAPGAKSAAVQGEYELKALELKPGLFKISLNIRNCTTITSTEMEDREEVCIRSLVSAHSILHGTGGRFISLLDPPEQYRPAADSCDNAGAWPVLAGDKKNQDTILAAPIILYDYPSASSGVPVVVPARTEDEVMLSLRILNMTDAQKLELRKG